MKDFSKLMQSSRLKAQARLKAYQAKDTSVIRDDKQVEKFKKQFVKTIMRNPTVLEDMMRDHPQEMNDLIERYG